MNELDDAMLEKIHSGVILVDAKHNDFLTILYFYRDLQSIL